MAMALIKSFEEKRMDRNSIHDAIDATYTTFERDGRRFMQIDSYGRAVREMPRQEEPINTTGREIRSRTLQNP
jgi:hypothetical protein